MRTKFEQLQQGVLLACLFFTEDEILGTNNVLLPTQKLPNCEYSQMKFLNVDSPEYEWLLNLGKDWSTDIILQSIEKMPGI
jgi:hypothetical protein